MPKVFPYIIAITAFLPALASSQTMTGNELLAALNKQDPIALHFVAGVVDAASTSRHFFDENPAGLSTQSAQAGLTGLERLWGCRPEKATYGQVADVTAAYMKKRPEIRHLDSTLIIAFAMKEAWPCPGR